MRSKSKLFDKKRLVANGLVQTICVIRLFMCERKVSNLFIYFFINKRDKQHKTLQKLNIHCYSNQVKELLYRIYSVRVFTVIDSAKRCECRLISAFVS